MALCRDSGLVAWLPCLLRPASISQSRPGTASSLVSPAAHPQRADEHTLVSAGQLVRFDSTGHCSNDAPEHAANESTVSELSSTVGRPVVVVKSQGVHHGVFEPRVLLAGA